MDTFSKFYWKEVVTCYVILDMLWICIIICTLWGSFNVHKHDNFFPLYTHKFISEKNDKIKINVNDMK